MLQLVLKMIGVSELSELISDMFKTAKNGLSFKIFREIFNLIGLEDNVYFLSMEQLMEIQPIPSILYLKEQQTFAVLNTIEHNNISLLVGKESSLVLNKKEFIKEWDGILLPIQDGSLIHLTKIAWKQTGYQIQPSEHVEFVALDNNSTKEESILLGRLNQQVFKTTSNYSFETTIPAWSTISIKANAIDEASEKPNMLMEYYLPLSLKKSVNVIRFHFIKQIGKENFDAIGIRGSINQIFTINE